MNRSSMGAALAVIVFAACDRPPPEVGASSLLDREREARCRFAARCGLAPDFETCLDAADPDADLVQALGLVPFGGTEYDAAAAGAYVEALESRTCDSTLDARREFEALRAAMFSGRSDPGDPCFGTDDCVGDAVCDRTMCPGNQQCCTGICVERRVLDIGDDCPLVDASDRLRARCADDAYCARPEGENDPQEGVCTARVDNGEACGSDQECLDGQRCSPEGRTCFILSGEDDMCSSALGPAACRDFDKTCGDEGSCVSLPGPGDACVEGRCLGYAVCVDDTCEARGGLGDDCDDLPCLGDLLCIDGTCTARTVRTVCISGDPPPEQDG